ncbi:hypothetical protein AMTRI_Chr03g56670 [Amborella trichopoda]
MDQAKLVARVPNLFESVDVPRLHGDVGGLKPNCLQNGSQVLIPNRKGERCPIEPRMVSLLVTITTDFRWEREKKFSRQVRSEKAQTSHFHFSIPLMSYLRGCIDLPKRTSKPSQYGKSVAPQLEW